MTDAEPPLGDPPKLASIERNDSSSEIDVGLSPLSNACQGLATIPCDGAQNQIRMLDDHALGHLDSALAAIIEEQELVIHEMSSTIKRLRSIVDSLVAPSAIVGSTRVSCGEASTGRRHHQPQMSFLNPGKPAACLANATSTENKWCAKRAQESLRNIRNDPDYGDDVKNDSDGVVGEATSAPGTVNQISEIITSHARVSAFEVNADDCHSEVDDSPVRSPSRLMDSVEIQSEMQLMSSMTKHRSTFRTYTKRRCWDIDVHTSEFSTWKLESDLNKSRSRKRASVVSEEQQATGDEGDKWVLRPHTRIRLIWDILAMVMLFYDLVAVPLRVFDVPPYMGIYVMDITVLAYWSMDFVLCFVTGVYKDGQLVLQRKRIALVYMTSWFAFDCLILMLEWLVMGSHGAIAGTNLQNLSYFRLLRIIKLDIILRNLKAWINSNACLLLIGLLKMTAGVIVLIHCLACAWFGLGTLNSDGWIFIEAIAKKPLGERYLYSFQFAMARLHPSAYDKNMRLVTIHERVFAIVTSLMALAGCGVLLSSITNTMAQLQSFRQQRTRNLFVLREYVRNYNIPVRVSNRVKNYIEKNHTRKIKEQHANELASLLPVTLLLDLRFEAWTPFMAPHDFLGEFSEIHPRTVRCLGKEALQELSVLGGESLFYTGDSCSRVLFLITGKMIYVLGCGPDVKAEDLMGQQRHVPIAAAVSEAALWTTWEHKGELSAVGDSSVLTLSAKDFMSIVREHERAFFDAVTRCDEVVQWMIMNELVVSDLLPNLSRHLPRSDSDFGRQVSGKSELSFQASLGGISLAGFWRQVSGHARHSLQKGTNVIPQEGSPQPRYSRQCSAKSVHSLVSGKS